MAAREYFQRPPAGECLLMHAGDVLEVSLRVTGKDAGRAMLRTNIGQAVMRRRELISHIENETPLVEKDWQDIPMRRAAPSVYKVGIPLLETGRFEAKACFMPAGAAHPEWAEGGNLVIKVEPAHTVSANTVYCAFPRLFLPERLEQRFRDKDMAGSVETDALDGLSYTVIPPSGTFRRLIGQLDTIVEKMGFRCIQLLPIHPVPTTHARMGRYGSPFASLDYFSVDPALAEFDRRSTPLDQFRELIDEVHARGARIFMDIPMNHTGWASIIQNHHPEWFARAGGNRGEFVSPGAWGIEWADLIKLDYRHRDLWRYMADVFVFWCGQGVDGFRCDAGYMIPEDTWAYIVARVRLEYPDTVFLLENLGGKWEITERLLRDANLNWAYSEIFQFEDRETFERELPKMIALSERIGPLIHYAETHDNNRLASRGHGYARLRTGLAALFSARGAFGITAGVEWFADEKIDVHELTGMNWGAQANQVAWIGRLNRLLSAHPAFGPSVRVRLVQCREGNALALLREAPEHRLLILANLDAGKEQPVTWSGKDFDPTNVRSLVSEDLPAIDALPGKEKHYRCLLSPGAVYCLGHDFSLESAEDVLRGQAGVELRQRLRLAALRVRGWLTGKMDLAEGEDVEAETNAFQDDPEQYCLDRIPAGACLPVTRWRWPEDQRRQVMIPSGHLLHISSPEAFQVKISDPRDEVTGESLWSVPTAGGHHAFLPAMPAPRDAALSCFLCLSVRNGGTAKRVRAPLLLLPEGGGIKACLRADGDRVRKGDLLALLTNGRGGMAQVRARWGEVRSQYDALLAANLHPNVPVDRVVVYTRCRGWVVDRGYSHEIDADQILSFESDPAGHSAEWTFRMQAGMGRWIPLTIHLEMPEGQNRIDMTVSRPVLKKDSRDALANTDSVEVILRPDIEWRNFHEKTKAFQGAERAWPRAVSPGAGGFVFQPAREKLVVHCDSGSFHSEPEWQYMVGHPEDAGRGLDGVSDLFSPGYFKFSLAGGHRVRVTAEVPGDDPIPAASSRESRFAKGTDPVEVLKRALDAYLVRREKGWTVVAGYPWFLDWGRDTLIFLRGVVAAGREDVVLDTLVEFARLEKTGTLPNMLHGKDDANRDTSDAPLWFIIAVRDLYRRMGDIVLDTVCGDRTLREVVGSIITHYLQGAGNGIRCDKESGLIFSPAHFTWMDTNHPAATPREGYPIEIQALWHQSLLFGRSVLDDPDLEEMAGRVAGKIEELFFLPEEGFFSDCIHASEGVAAAEGVCDHSLRCNQVLALALGAVTKGAYALRALRACEPLLVPGALRSLADREVSPPLRILWNERLLGDPHHPYRGRYEGDEDTRRKPAYHNGTAWTWVFPSYVEALLELYGSSAHGTAAALLGSVAEWLNTGCIGHIPEILDGDYPHTRRGCSAQAWGVSEFLRVWKKLSGSMNIRQTRR